MQGAFAYMDGRVDPPSSIHRMTADTLNRHAAEGEVWAIGEPPLAAFILTPGPSSLSICKLAVATSARGRGLARRLTDVAEERARALRLPWLELQTRIELIDNHATFAALGFSMIAETAHPGFSRPTSLTFRRPVSQPPQQRQDRSDPR